MGRFNIEAGTKYRISNSVYQTHTKSYRNQKINDVVWKTHKKGKKQGNKIIKMTMLKSVMFYDWTVLNKISEGEKGTML